MRSMKLKVPSGDRISSKCYNTHFVNAGCPHYSVCKKQNTADVRYFFTVFKLDFENFILCRKFLVEVFASSNFLNGINNQINRS